MMTVDCVIRFLEELKDNGVPGDSPCVIDRGEFLTEIEEIDLDANDESTVVIWCGDRVD